MNETNKTIEKMDETKGWFFGKKDKPLARLRKKRETQRKSETKEEKLQQIP